MERSEATMHMATVVSVLVVLPTALLVLSVMVMGVAMTDPLQAPNKPLGSASAQPIRVAQGAIASALETVHSTAKEP